MRHLCIDVQFNVQKPPLYCSTPHFALLSMCTIYIPVEDAGEYVFLPLQLMSAVEYIHSMGVAHGDIRAENLLLNKDGSRMKIAGFGRAVRVDVDVNGEDYVYRRRKAYSSSREHEKLLHAQHDHIGRTHAARPGGAGDASLASDM